MTRWLLLVAFLPYALTAQGEPQPISSYSQAPVFMDVQVSPDGKHLAVLYGPYQGHVLGFFDTENIRPVGKMRPLETGRASLHWISDRRIMFIRHTSDFNRARTIGAMDVGGGNFDQDLAKKLLSLQAWIRVISPMIDDPDRVLIADYFNEKPSVKLVMLNVHTGRDDTVELAPGHGVRLTADHKHVGRFAVGTQRGNAVEVHGRPTTDGDWRVFPWRFQSGDEGPIGFQSDNRHAYVLAYDGHDTMGVYLYDTEDKSWQLLSRHESVDPERFFWSVDKSSLIAVGYEDGYPSVDLLEKNRPESFLIRRVLKEFPDHGFEMTSVSRDGNTGVFRVYSDVTPDTWYLVKNDGDELVQVARNYEALDPTNSQTMQPVKIPTDEEFQLSGYLVRSTSETGKLIVMASGLPGTHRHLWGFDPLVQFLVSRGYSVLKVNSRGARGFGWNFLKSSDGQWGDGVQTDLATATKWAIKNKIADPDSVCIYGDGFGGYSATMGTVIYPELYACGITFNGIYNLGHLKMVAKQKPWAGPASPKEPNSTRTALGKDWILPRLISPVHHRGNFKQPILLIDWPLSPPYYSRLYGLAASNWLEKMEPNIHTTIVFDENVSNYSDEFREFQYEKTVEFLSRALP